MAWKNWMLGILLLTAIVVAFLALRGPAELGPGECVPNWPRVVADGKMYTHGFGIPYQLGYEGVFEVSGAPCIAWRRVSKTEYERRMYE